uniref:Uncharacterized protein n=1 Tax=Oryza sativa subsp. japonica TaxID=39947 RepID=Q7XDV6_ORYSJ|nr:hypothetical protein LOC_Os10g31280 [Oryza sativa Japonica Group]
MGKGAATWARRRGRGARNGGGGAPVVADRLEVGEGADREKNFWARHSTSCSPMPGKMTTIFNLLKIIPCLYGYQSKSPHQIRQNFSRSAKIGQGFLIHLIYSFHFPQNQSIKLGIKIIGEDRYHHRQL